jgi:cytochrome c biogenesis protein CcdA/thioredoxin-related protein
MKKFLLVFLFSCTALSAIRAQVTAVATAERVSAEKGIVRLSITIGEGLQIFSTNPNNDEDGFISSIELEPNEKVKIIAAKIKESGKDTVISNETIGTGKKVFSGELILEVPVSIDNEEMVTLQGKFNYLGIEGDGFPNGVAEFSVEMPALSSVSEADEVPAGEQPKKGWGLFLITFLVGFGAVFTPCVFPLMPVTVSFFLKKSKSRAEGVRNAWTYALSIILIYTIPTLILTLIFGDKFLYQLSTHPISNLVFFMIFLMFAISFFGAFEITLPSSWANKTDSAAQRGGLVGIFFMALTLVIVSFSCTGPIVGALLGETSGKGISMGPVIGMLGFGLGLAIPFGVLALFPSMLQSLPKSGGWLNTVKVFFGFIELALAMKFFSNADLVYHWGILTRPVFLAGWIVIFTLLGMYMIGKLKFSHDSDLPYISVPRIFVAMISFTFALYMVPGMWGAPLKPLSGILPPPSTQDFDLDKLQYISNTGGSQTPSTGSLAPAPVKFVDKFHVPFGLTAYFDLDEAKVASKILKKPIMLDFTGWSCANCRKMENEVWSKPEILQRLKNDFVLVSLFVDDRTALPLNEQYTNERGDKIKTIGDKNLEFEISEFNLNAQPLYKFMDHEGNYLSNIQYGYDPDVTKFAAHLDAMKAVYSEKWP